MRLRKKRIRESGLPPELHASYRAVRLSGAGLFALTAVVFMLAAAVWMPVLLYPPLREAELAVAGTKTTTGEIIAASKQGGERMEVTYRYLVNGQAYTGRASAGQEHSRKYRAGARIPVYYAASDPGSSQIRRRRPPPVWLVFLIPPVLVGAAGPLVLFMRRQAHLLSEGRPAVATVLTSEKRRGSSGESVWRVEYEWTLLSGAKRRGRFDSKAKDASAPGKTIPILYDRDNPHRHARYPLALVRLRPR